MLVYPARGSHAAYFAPQLWLSSNAATGLGCDDARFATDLLHPEVQDAHRRQRCAAMALVRRAMGRTTRILQQRTARPRISAAVERAVRVDGAERAAVGSDIRAGVRRRDCLLWRHACGVPRIQSPARIWHSATTHHRRDRRGWHRHRDSLGPAPAPFAMVMAAIAAGVRGSPGSRDCRERRCRIAYSRDRRRGRRPNRRAVPSGNERRNAGGWLAIHRLRSDIRRAPTRQRPGVGQVGAGDAAWLSLRDAWLQWHWLASLACCTLRSEVR